MPGTTKTPPFEIRDGASERRTRREVPKETKRDVARRLFRTQRGVASRTAKGHLLTDAHKDADVV